MKKKITLILFITVSCGLLHAQNKFTDSLLHQLRMVKDDTSRVLAMADLCYFYRYTNIDSAFFYGQSALALAQQIKFLRGEAGALNKLGLALREKGDLPKSLELEFRALKIAKENNYPLETADCFRRIGHVYMDLNDYPNAVNYAMQALKIDVEIQNDRRKATEDMDLGMIYQQMNQPDSALLYARDAFEKINLIEDLSVEVYRVLGNIQSMKGNKNEALGYYKRGIQVGLKINDFRTISFIYANMAAMYKQLKQSDSSIYYAKKGVEYGQIISYKKGILLSGNLLSELYDSANPKEALRYYRLASAAKDSLFGAGNIQTIQTLIAEANERQKEAEATKAAYQTRLRQYGLLAGLGLALLIALILYRNNRQKQKTNKVLEATLSNLKSTQSQLIQSEKMASLGELTAGIAHEIQNPLNFVNNFSEVNTELMDELELEAEKGDMNQVKIIARDIKENSAIINHHGKRADSIVKGMLQHSRSGAGIKEATDLNKLADDYFRLAFNGFKAKGHDFPAAMQTDFDENIEKINIIPQDIGKVLLNVYNNAWYAVNEKKKTQPEEYEPTVSVGTKKTGSKISITVTDNGNGIPPKIVDKIFQPFFTTKPTGQGTGLGLSLSYDIVKAHGGEIRVETKEGKGTSFIILLPVA